MNFSAKLLIRRLVFLKVARNGQEITQTCVTFVGNNWWTREGFYSVGGGLEDGDMFLDNR